MNKITTKIGQAAAIIIGLIALVALIWLLGFIVIGAWRVWTTIF